MAAPLQGMRVFLLARDAAGLATALRERGAAVSVTSGPFGFDERPAAAVESARAELGGLDAVVTVAPPVTLELLENVNLGDWRERFRRYVEEPFCLVQAWLQDALARAVPGRWVAVTSNLGTQPFPSGGAVGAAAAALHTLVRIAAVEYGPHGIRANAVAVGWYEGALPAALGSDGAALAVEDTPARWLAGLDDVAGTVAWLLSPDAAFVNGEVVRVDGGYTITRSSRAAPSQALERRLLDETWWGVGP